MAVFFLKSYPNYLGMKQFMRNVRTVRVDCLGTVCVCRVWFIGKHNFFFSFTNRAGLLRKLLTSVQVLCNTCQLTCDDIIPVRQLAAQGGEGESRQDNFCSPQLLNSLTVTSQSRQNA